jgi:hypothetical protein
MRGLIARRCSRVHNVRIIRGRWIEDKCWHARSFVLENKFARKISVGLVKVRGGVEHQKVWDVRV